MQIAYAIDYKPQGIKSFIISSGHPSSSLWEREGLRRIKMMPQDMQDAINHALETGDFTGEAYDAAVAEYMDRYCNYWLGEDAPECCKRPKNPVLNLMLKDGDQMSLHLQALSRTSSTLTDLVRSRSLR